MVFAFKQKTGCVAGGFTPGDSPSRERRIIKLPWCFHVPIIYNTLWCTKRLDQNCPFISEIFFHDFPLSEDLKIVVKSLLIFSAARTKMVVWGYIIAVTKDTNTWWSDVCFYWCRNIIYYHSGVFVDWASDCNIVSDKEYCKIKSNQGSLYFPW